MSTAIYVFKGYDLERRATAGHAWKSPPETGFMGLVDLCDLAGDMIDEYCEANPDMDYPGVFDYEVSEHMGAWMYYSDDRSAEAFKQELNHYVQKQLVKTR